MNIANNSTTISYVRRNYRWFILLIRTFSILFTGLYIVFFYQVLFEWYAYTLRYFIAQFFVYLIYGIGCNFGLFFITTDKAKKTKIWTTIFYLPTMFVTPIVVGAFQPYYTGIFIAFLISILIYCHFNPWKNNG